MIKRESIISDILRISDMCNNQNLNGAEQLAQNIIIELKILSTTMSVEDLQLINSYLQKSISDLKASQLEVKIKLDKNKASSKLSDIYHANKHH